MKVFMFWQYLAQSLQYELFQVVSAEDEGSKSSTTTVNIGVTDINDQDPQFKNQPYSFRVKEGAVDAFVGRVFAEDADEGANANISYSVPDESPFSIDPLSGKISTKTSLDFESNQVHYVLVTAKDAGQVPRSVSATATVLVQDSDETNIILSGWLINLFF